jgi:DNA-directed RNA polymerase subunit RPC12/RpoP
MRRVTFSCQHCGTRIWVKDGVYVDDTGGDVCCADTFMEKNVNGEHQPKVMA